MAKKTAIFMVTLAVLGGALSTSIWAFEEVDPTIQKQLEQAKEQNSTFGRMPSQDGTDAFPSRLGAGDGDTSPSSDAAVPPQSDPGWKDGEQGDCKYAANKVACGWTFKHPSLGDRRYLNMVDLCYSFFKKRCPSGKKDFSGMAR